MKKIRTVIAEDHLILRDGLRFLLEKSQKFEIVAETEDGLSALESIQNHLPDLLILDISMPKMNGLSVLKEIKSRYPEVKTIVLTVHDSEEYIKEAFQAGAAGYCLKRNSFDELLLAIEYAIDGKIFVSPSITRPMLQGYLKKDVGNAAATPWESLTLREKEI